MNMRSTAQIQPGSRSRSEDRRQKKEINLTFDLTESVDRFVSAVENNEAEEYAIYGTRGDGKTQGVLTAMVLHAVKHRDLKYPVPATWMGVADTFESHKEKTVPSLSEPHWEGRWKLSDGKKVAHFYIGKVPLVELHLFGIEDQGAIDKVRRAAVGQWYEEAAPVSVLVKSSGLSELSWSTGLTSLRSPSFSNPAILSENYPDEDHWSWRRWNPGAGTYGFHHEMRSRMWFRIPPGERASADQRAKWQNALKDRPDILRRLLSGQPGTLQLGPQVAVGFQRDVHVAHERIFPTKGEPLVIGQDFGHTPTTVIGQPWRGFFRVYAALTIERGGVKQLLEQSVLPWMKTRAPWAFSGDMIIGRYDASSADEQTDIERNPVDLLETNLPGFWQPGPVSWEARKNTLLPAFNQHAGPKIPALVIDPVDADGLVKALDGRWYYPQTAAGELRSDLPKKPNHPWEDYGDAFCYFLDGALPEARLGWQRRKPVVVHQHFDPRVVNTQPTVKSQFDPRMRR